MSKHTEKFIKGALILSLAGIIAKVASIFYKIPLVYLVGDEGLGYYQIVFNIFTSMIAAGLVGIPSATSKLVSEEIANHSYGQAHQTFKDTLLISVVIGFIVSLAMLVGAYPMIQISGWSRSTIYVIMGLSIAPVFVYVSGAFKGYFQGLQIMTPSAYSQVIENVSKVILTVALVYMFLGQGFSIGKAVSGAAIGTSMGYVLSMFFMIGVYKKKVSQNLIKISPKGSYKEKGHLVRQIKRILNLAIPVSIATAVFSIMNGIDSLTLYQSLRLQGLQELEITKIAGQMSKAFSIINFPLVISVAIAMSIIPAIAEAVAKKNQEDLISKINQGLKLSIIIALPSAVGIYMLASPIIRLLFPTSTEGAVFLKYYAVCLIFIIIGQSLTGILQGISKQMLPLISLSIAVVVKIVLNLTLTQTYLEARGATIASIIYYIIFVVCNYILLKKNVSFKLEKKNTLLKPLFATGFMIVSVYFCYEFGKSILNSNAIITLVTISVGAFVYFTVLFITKAFTREELSLLPKHEKIIGFLERKKYFN